MNSLLRQGIVEYRRSKETRKRFHADARRLYGLVQVGDVCTSETLVLLLTPLIEVAWVDGRVGRAEQNAILDVADSFRLLEDENSAVIVMDRLMTRPSRDEIDRWWHDLEKVLRFLPLGRTAAVGSLLLEQVHYIAGLGQKELYGLWRGHKAGEEERIAVAETNDRIAKLNELDPLEKKESLRGTGSEDSYQVLPLVKVAWSDGRITKRERELIFDSLFELGVEPTNENLRQILDWLEFRPNDSFYISAIEKLRQRFETLSADQHADAKYGLISQCTLVAEASGGNSSSPSGGPKICQEEIDTVKHIARLLSGAARRN